MTLPYAPFEIEVTTPTLQLLGATDERLERLLPIVRAGVVQGDELPFDDPMSLYEPSPIREWRWLRAIWAARAGSEPSSWRLCLVVEVNGEALGVQDLIAKDFPTYAAATTFSWLAPDARGKGLGREMRAAILHLAFAGFGAREATSDAFEDNTASNSVSRALGYEENGSDWATRRGTPCRLQRWVLSRARWEPTARTDIQLTGVDACRKLLEIA